MFYRLFSLALIMACGLLIVGAMVVSIVKKLMKLQRQKKLTEFHRRRTERRLKQTEEYEESR